MATVLVAMVGYAILFTGLRLLNEVLKAPPAFIGVVGLFFAVVAISQAVAIRWNNPRAASAVAGLFYWVICFAVIAGIYGMPAYLFFGLYVVVFMISPIAGYLAGTLVGGVFLISHYLRESNGLRHQAPEEVEDADSPWGVTPSSMPPANDTTGRS